MIQKVNILLNTDTNGEKMEVILEFDLNVDPQSWSLALDNVKANLYIPSASYGQPMIPDTIADGSVNFTLDS